MSSRELYIFVLGGRNLECPIIRSGRKLGQNITLGIKVYYISL
jgi:hypothetical protein